MTATRAITRLKDADDVSRASSLDEREPFYIAHRGSSYVFPENTIEAYLGSLAQGHDIIKAGDYWTLLDGALGCMHDQTLDRTTSSAGNVQAHTASSWRTIAADPSTWLAPSWPNMAVPLIDDVLQALQFRAIVFLDAKSPDGSGAKIVQALQRWGMEKQAVVCSFNQGELAAAISAGITACYQSFDPSPTLANAAGCKYIAVDYTHVSDAWIPTAIAAGFKVIIYTPNDRVTRDHYLSLGVSGFFSDDPSWLDGSIKTLQTDPFALQTFYSGMIGNPTYTFGDRGSFVGGNRWGFQSNGTRWACIGFLDLGATPPTTWQLQTTITFDQLSSDSTRHPGIAFCVDIDQFNEGGVQGNGYHLFLRQNGTLELFDNTTNTQIGLMITPAVAAGAAVPFTIQVTPTTITVFRNDMASPNSFTITNTAHRGRYFHFGKNDSGAGGLHCSFSNVTRS